MLPWRLLVCRQRRQEDRNQAVLPPRQAVVGMAGHLEQEPAVPPLMDKGVLARSFDRQTAKDKRSGASSNPAPAPPFSCTQGGDKFFLFQTANAYFPGDTPSTHPFYAYI